MSERELSEWNMASLNFKRYHAMFEKADELAIICRNRDTKHFRNYFSVLTELYNNLEPIIKDVKTFTHLLDEIEVLLEDYEQEMAMSKKIYWNKPLFKKMEELHKHLMRIQQYVGLGVPTYKDESLDKKLENALGI